MIHDRLPLGCSVLSRPTWLASPCLHELHYNVAKCVICRFMRFRREPHTSTADFAISCVVIVVAQVWYVRLIPL